ncbi:hypothetical protein [Methanobacterium sp. SMA-27]|uniref:hypothetical protein n=1 Tax=Methanobacterium sp. SMA-27 TaxID=1495336 RepID=UPI000AB18D59|nr:hypothetical protein [Methanobacterium sp. SMA-27]
MKLTKIEGKIIQECDFGNDKSKIVFTDGTILEFEMCLDGDPPLLNVFLTKPGKERKLY